MNRAEKKLMAKAYEGLRKLDKAATAASEEGDRAQTIHLDRHRRELRENIQDGARILR